jgi:hypothetical protein
MTYGTARGRLFSGVARLRGPHSWPIAMLLSVVRGGWSVGTLESGAATGETDDTLDLVRPEGDGGVHAIADRPWQVSDRGAARRRWPRRLGGFLEDAALLAAIVFLIPLIILLVGAPVALGVRAVLAVVRFFS